MYYKDCKGTLIEEGDKVRYRKKKGIIVKENGFERREGLYAELENGHKVRVQDVHRRMYVIYKARKKHHNVGKRK